MTFPGSSADGTRSLSQEIKGINPLVEENEARIINGQRVVSLLEALRKDKENRTLIQQFNEVKGDLATACCSRSTSNDVTQATPQQTPRTRLLSTVPAVTPMYWMFA